MARATPQLDCFTMTNASSTQHACAPEAHLGRLHVEMMVDGMNGGSRHYDGSMGGKGKSMSDEYPYHDSVVMIIPALIHSQR